MKRAFTVLAITGLITLAVWLLPYGLATLLEQAGGEKPALAYLSSGSKLGAAYARWVAGHEARGGDQKVALSLRWAKGLSAEFTPAVGQVELDLTGGSVSVDVRGLDLDTEWQVWLVDNVPGPDRSAAPEAGDKMLYAGPLRNDGGVARLRAQLGARAFTDFDVDLVVVARPGEGELSSRGLLFGMRTLFQRFYTRARLGRPSEEGSSLLARWTGSSAYATGADTTVATFNNLVIRGADLFFNETFNGNGRTCGTCHPAENNFTIDPKWIASQPRNNPLFAAEFMPALAEGFETPTLMRSNALIRENVDGFEDLRTKFVMRSVPHIFALNTSLKAEDPGPPNELTGWGGDGAPGNGTLREFAIGAVTQHFPRTLARRPGRDFRLPTPDELDAMEAFQRFVGRDSDPNLADMMTNGRLRGAKARRGLEIFMADDTQGGTVAAGKCNLCHFNAGATSGPEGFNGNFNTGVEQLVDTLGDLVDPRQNPTDGGLGRQANGTAGFGDGSFNTPPLVEAADTPPFFHNNAVATIEGAVAFFNSKAFENSGSGQFLASVDSGKIGIRLEPTHVEAIAAFLRVLNALENIRAAGEVQRFVMDVRSRDSARDLLKLARKDTQDAVEVLENAGLHPVAVAHLRRAMDRLDHARHSHGRGDRSALIRQALTEQTAARRDLIRD